jgi:FKBP-type peptidyl-prolyl cis-trans isomerase 2
MAYGERDADLIRPVERRTLPPDQVIAPESMIEFEHQDGSPLPGVVIEVTPEHVVVDFNHPLAGMEVEFEVEVVGVVNTHWVCQSNCVTE